MKIQVTNSIVRFYSFEIKVSSWELILKQAKKQGYEIPESMIDTKTALNKYLVDVFSVPKHCTLDYVESPLDENNKPVKGLVIIGFSEPEAQVTQTFSQQKWGIGLEDF